MKLYFRTNDFISLLLCYFISRSYWSYCIIVDTINSYYNGIDQQIIVVISVIYLLLLLFYYSLFLCLFVVKIPVSHYYYYYYYTDVCVVLTFVWDICF